MNDNAFWRWAGYLCNPLREAQIHVEAHPDKADLFRREYKDLTGEELSLPGDKTPFYVWAPGANKWGIQRRVYFKGEENARPEIADGGFRVVAGRAVGQWRINSKVFIPRLLEAGFLLGSGDYQVRVQQRVPSEFKAAFDSGFNILGRRELAVFLARSHCNKKGIRTFSSADLLSAWENNRRNAGLPSLENALRELSVDAKILTHNQTRGAYTLRTDLLENETESAIAQIAASPGIHPEKREYLVEVYARDRGWVRAAKRIFGEYCMVEKCANTFIKEDGSRYIEAHHIVPLCEGGEEGIWNLSVLCAHHHRQAHFARKVERVRMRDFLREKVQTATARPAPDSN